MTLNQLYQVIQQTFAAEGLKLSDTVVNSLNHSTFIIQDELVSRPVVSSISSYKAIYGHSMIVYPTYHRNQALEDTSYTVEICDWNCSSCGTYKRIKVSKNQTEPTVVRKLKAFIEEYKEYIKQIQLEKKLDTFLGI